MKVIEANSDEAGLLRSLVPDTYPEQSAALRTKESGPDLEATFRASWERENFMYSLGSRINRRMNAEGDFTEADPTWNPYRYVRENWPENKRRTFEFELRGGLFEHTTNAAELNFLADQLAAEKERLNIIGAGSAWGNVMGSIAGSLMDITTLTPLGFVNRLRTGSRIVKGLVAGFAATTPQEIGLQATQELRTAQETFLNIGSGTALGGGLGAFVAAMHPRHPLNPANPANPLRIENIDHQGVGIRSAEGETEVISARPIGAAVAPVAAPHALPGILDSIPGVSWLGEKITGVTPAGRALNYTGDQSRSILVRLMDLGGVLTDTNRFGVATAHSAEDLKRDLLVLRDNVFIASEKAVRDLNEELGANQFASSIGLRGKIDDASFFDVTRRRLLNEWTDEDTKALGAQYGEAAAPQIIAKADTIAERVHATNAIFERELIELGKLQDPKRIAQLQKDLADARGKVESAASPDEKGRWREHRDRLAGDLSSELAKPKSLGRNYGHAQLWDPHSIIARQEEFEDYLLGVLADKPDADWLATQFRVTPDDFAKLGREPVTVFRHDPATGKEAPSTLSPVLGTEERKRILREWSGDEHVYRINRAERQAAGASEALKQAELDLTDTLRGFKWASIETHKLELSEARKFRDLFRARIEEARAKNLEADLMRRAFVEAAEAARTRSVTRDAFAKPATSAELTRAEEAVAKAEKDLFVSVSDALKDPASRGRFVNSGEYVKLRDALTQAEAKIDDLIARTPDAPETARLARAEQRAIFYAREADKAARLAKSREGALQRIEPLYTRVAEKLELYQKAKAGIADSLDDAKKARSVAALDARSAMRELARSEGRTPLASVVEEISHKLTNRNELPISILDGVAAETGRVKARRLRLTPDQRREAERLGFLRTDLSAILHSQYEQLSGYIGLHRALDIQAGGRFDSWANVLRTVDDEYRDLIRSAKDDAVKTKLNAERQRVTKDVNLLKDRVLGTENVGADRDGWAYWLSKKAREANFVRFGAGFLLPSLTDVAAISLRTGSLGKLLLERAPNTVRVMRELYKAEPSEFRAVLNAQELGINGGRMARLLDAEDSAVLFGIGPKGTFKHTFTANVDRAGAWLSDKTMLISGLRTWNRFWKISAGIERAYKLRDLTTAYASLKPRDVADLASLGIDREAARRISRMVNRYGEIDQNGHWDPRLEEWSAVAEGRQAAREFRIAVERDMSRAVFTPGIGDTPGIMSRAAGKLWLQFQTYSFTFLNRFMIPASQRIANYRDAQAMVAYAHLLWSGMLVVIGKDILNGRDPMERFSGEKWEETSKEILDRSGVLTYLSPYVDSLLKVSAPLQETVFGGVKVGPTSRFARNAWMESSFGASYGLMRDMQSFGSAIAEGDAEKITKKGLVLAPANFYLRLMNSLSEPDLNP